MFVCLARPEVPSAHGRASGVVFSPLAYGPGGWWAPPLKETIYVSVRVDRLATATSAKTIPVSYGLTLLVI